MIEYMRNRHAGDGKTLSFEKPENPDKYDTPSDAILKKLPKPIFVKDKMAISA